MSITPTNLIKHELIGLSAEVLNSSNKSNRGICGKIIDETQHTLLLQRGNTKKRVFKKAVELKIILPDKTKVAVMGRLLVGRPWERIKKKTGI